MKFENRLVVNAIEEKITSLRNEAKEVCEFDKEAYDIFYKDEIESLEKSLHSLNEEAMTVEDSIDNDIFFNSQLEEQEEEIDEDLEAWKLDQLNKDYKFGTNSWDL
ncbi:hypothetical protein C672_3589 [[Clostridium] bifermentans ATCC 638]|uniref:Uncharacterized protein n=2 Tax=Clostridia TaxID=186801 RepID=T4VF87_PARBF|nr:hypothetical protein [Paraclostridium bifermentans]EQK39780.1 hypothetical protein C672_3589 [[Clostridium] bifermentans ATCC 638] [Paraclostridium bifermentans ATCC 638 = DSM 14991]RIZ57419.1 hypothetical protein CHH45_16410 [Paraclostridium bifermentans]